MTEPHALDIEMAVLGAALISGYARENLLISSPAIFYDHRNRAIHETMVELHQTGTPIDILTLKTALKKADKLEWAGGLMYVMSLTDTVASDANQDHHIQLLKEKHAARELLKFANKVKEIAYDTFNAPDLLLEMEGIMYRTAAQMIGTSPETPEAIFQDFVSHVEQKIADPGRIWGVPSGIFRIDRLTNGFLPGDLIIVAARPSMGKSDFSLNICRHAAKNGFRPGMIALEMVNRNILSRLVSMETQTNKSAFREGWKEISENGKLRADIQQAAKYFTANLSLFDKGGMGLAQIETIARRMVMQEGCKLIVIDHLQLVGRDRKQSAHHATGEITRGLKNLAKSLNIPIILLSQLSRAIESRNEKRPILSDLRESGSIEEDADTVFFLYRPEYYGETVLESGESAQGYCEVIIAKNREGELGFVKTEYRPAIGTFSEWQGMRIFPGEMADQNKINIPNSSYEYETPF